MRYFTAVPWLQKRTRGKTGGYFSIATWGGAMVHPVFRGMSHAKSSRGTESLEEGTAGSELEGTAVMGSVGDGVPPGPSGGGFFSDNWDEMPSLREACKKAMVKIWIWKIAKSI